MHRWTLPLALAACATSPIAGVDTSGEAGRDSDAIDTSGATCDVHLRESIPAEGAQQVYARAPIVLTFSGDAIDALVEVRDPEGVAATLTPTWSEGNAILELNGSLEPDTAYTIHVESCNITQEVHFTTSVVGGMSIEPAELVGRTFSFALKDAVITEPAILEVLDDASLTMPLGFMVQYADAAQLEILGALLVNTESGLQQVEGSATWDFPTADFAEAPFFALELDTFTLVYSDPAKGLPETDIVFYDFHFAGSFTSAGNSIVQGTVDTVVDTRTLGPLFNVGDEPGAVCEYASSFAVDCVACPDGEDYCLHTVGEDITAPWIEGLTIVQ